MIDSSRRHIDVVYNTIRSPTLNTLSCYVRTNTIQEVKPVASLCYSVHCEVGYQHAVIFITLLSEEISRDKGDREYEIRKKEEGRRKKEEGHLFFAEV